MKIKLIRELLHENSFGYPALAVLQPNENLYTALLVQPEAKIQVRDDCIRNADRTSALSMFRTIAQKAHTDGIELFVTPEYSFPWETIEELLGNGTVPETGKLWVLGAESLTVAELPGLKARFSQWATVLHEDLAPNQPGTARYLDPLVYLFRTAAHESTESRLVMIVQFKTAPSGDALNIEATGMAKGDQVYLFDQGNEVRLMTLLCSDAFAFTEAEIDANYENLLLLHLQLNESPRHETYMRYRRRIYGFECDQTEVICLNWAENFTFDLADGVAATKKSNISASAWHSKSRKFATEDVHVELNHSFGLYYTRDVDQQRHMLHFTYKPAAFFLRATKARHHAVEAAKSRRRGPEVTQVLSWHADTNAWVAAPKPVDDGFVAMTAEYGAPANALDTCHATSPLAVERISCITAGDLGPGGDWYQASSLPTTRLESRTEVVKRVTVTQDPDGKPFRDSRVRAIKAFASIPSAKLPLPPQLTDLRDGYQFMWSAKAPHCNITSVKTGSPATVVYAGESPLRSDLASMYARAIATTSNSTHADRVCLFYREGETVKKFEPKSPRSIARSTSRPGKDFTEPEK